jgi:hypothetical protein
VSAASINADNECLAQETEIRNCVEPASSRFRALREW